MIQIQGSLSSLGGFPFIKCSFRTGSVFMEKILNVDGLLIPTVHTYFMRTMWDVINFFINWAVFSYLLKHSIIWSIWSAISFSLLALLSVLLYSIRQVFKPVLIQFICYLKSSNVSRWISIFLFAFHINLDSSDGPEVLISLRLLYSHENQTILKIKEISLWNEHLAYLTGSPLAVH